LALQVTPFALVAHVHVVPLGQVVPVLPEQYFVAHSAFASQLWPVTLHATDSLPERHPFAPPVPVPPVPLPPVPVPPVPAPPVPPVPMGPQDQTRPTAQTHLVEP